MPVLTFIWRQPQVVGTQFVSSLITKRAPIAFVSGAAQSLRSVEETITPFSFDTSPIYGISPSTDETAAPFSFNTELLIAFQAPSDTVPAPFSFTST